MSQPGFWDDTAQARKVSKRTSVIKEQIESFERLSSELEEVEVLIELGREEEDSSVAEEIHSKLVTLEEEVEELQLKTLLQGEYDQNNALLS
ncbi:MAG: PCRF domain-containing protein, partial [Bacillota bacterium]